MGSLPLMTTSARTHLYNRPSRHPAMCSQAPSLVSSHIRNEHDFWWWWWLEWSGNPCNKNIFALCLHKPIVPLIWCQTVTSEHTNDLLPAYIYRIEQWNVLNSDQLCWLSLNGCSGYKVRFIYPQSHWNCSSPILIKQSRLQRMSHKYPEKNQPQILFHNLKK